MLSLSTYLLLLVLLIHFLGAHHNQQNCEIKAFFDLKSEKIL